MSKLEEKKTRKLRSLRVTLAIAFLALSAVVLLIASSLDIYFNLQTQQELIANQQQLIAREAANSVKGFVQKKLGVLEGANRIGNLAVVHHEVQKLVLEKVLGLEPAFRQLVLLNAQGQELIKISRLSSFTMDQLTEQVESDLFLKASREKRYIGSIYIDKITSEPLVIMAVPVTNIFGDCNGILMAEVNLKFMWDLVGSMRIGKNGLAYVVDRQGNLIAFGDISRVLGRENLAHLEEVNEFIHGNGLVHESSSEISRGIQDTYVLATHVHLGMPDWAVVVELPVLEAYETVIMALKLSILIMLLSFALAIVAGIYLSKRITKPIINLRDATGKVSKGNLDTKIEVTSRDEIGELATSFNQMVEDLNKTTVSRDLLAKEVAERKRVEEALRKAEGKYRMQFEGALDAIFIADAETGIIIDLNPAAAKLAGREKSELIGQQQRVLHPPETIEGKFSLTFKQHLREEQGQTLETQVITKGGEKRDVAIKANIFEVRGKKLIQGIFRDITERKRAEKALKRANEELKKSEERYRTLVDNIDLSINHIDSDHNIVMVNASTVRRLDKSINEIIGNKCYRENENRDAVCPHCPGVQTLATGQPAEVENELVREAQKRFHVRLQTFPIHDQDGKVTGFIEIAEDITERKQIEEALRKSEEKYRTILDAIEDGYFEVDIRGDFTFFNDSLGKILGYFHDEIMGMNNRQYTDKENARNLYQAFNKVYETGEPNKGIQYEIMRKDGTRRHVESTASLIKDAEGRRIGFRGIMRDITERRRMEEALRQSEERHRTLIETMKVGLSAIDQNGVCTYANDQFCDMLGYSMEEIIGRRSIDFMDEGNRKAQEEVWAKRRKGMQDPTPYEITWTRKDGRKVQTIISPTPSFDADGHYTGSFGIMTDITERKRMEEEVKEANRRLIKEMREREEFLRIVSHDLGAPVRNISGMAASIIRKYGEGMDDDVKDRLARVQRNAEHELGLIGDLLELSRIKTRRGRFEEVDLGALVKGIGDGLSNQLEEKGINFKVAQDLPVVFCERNRMMQVFQNLIDNACKYMDSNKNPRIEVGFEELDDSYRFSVSDNGIGIREEDQERIFYVFNRVRNPVTSQVEGKGVGLSAVKAIVEAYGGEVWVESSPKGIRKGKGAKGSRFYFTLVKEALGRRAGNEGRGEHSIGG